MVEEITVNSDTTREHVKNLHQLLSFFQFETHQAQTNSISPQNSKFSPASVKHAHPISVKSGGTEMGAHKKVDTKRSRANHTEGNEWSEF
jgi:hypothetical protein